MAHKIEVVTRKYSNIYEGFFSLKRPFFRPYDIIFKRWNS